MFSKKVIDSLSGASMIRAMFEEGNRLRKVYGAENVYDFSIGNPEIEPPEPVLESLRKHASSTEKGTHRYMPNGGLESVRAKVATWISSRYDVLMPQTNIVMVTGAAAGLNVALKALLNQGEEVIVLAPYFVEYLAYIKNAEGVPVVVNLEKKDFHMDVAGIGNAVTANTKAIIINSPNNPTGAVFSEEELIELSQVLERKGQEFNTEIYVISDEPYNSIIYDGVKLPNILEIFRNAIVVNSFSKSLALPGERIGYIAASASITDVSILMDALISLNRTLGFVNAPALFQRVVADNLDVVIDNEFYMLRRDTLFDHLKSIGFNCIKPRGAFYLFPESPIPDDVEFAQRALKYNILLVPGSAFGCPGHFRLSFCVNMSTITGSLPAFSELAKECGM